MRPTLLVAEPEPLAAMSALKLVLETSNFNVLTAHSTKEALKVFRSFPNVSAAVLVKDERLDCDHIATDWKTKRSDLPIIVMLPTPGESCRGADHCVGQDEPENCYIFSDHCSVIPGR